MNDKIHFKSKIESILFVVGDQIKISKIAKILNAKKEEIYEAILSLQKEYSNKGINVILKDDYVQMVTNPKNSELIKQIVSSDLEEELSKAALETLSIIAYKEPITREEIDELRGVNSRFSIKNLLVRGLIKKEKKDEKIFYKTTIDFLRKLGIKDVKELPEYETLSKMDITN